MTTNKHVAPEPPETLQDRFRDAIAPRTLALGVGVLLLQFAFILSYIGAFHSPSPHQIPVTLVAPPQMAGKLVTTNIAYRVRPREHRHPGVLDPDPDRTHRELRGDDWDSL